MNMPNQQEAAIQAAAGGNIYKLRSTFTAPEGRLIISSDYKQAEIAALAYLSGDENLIRVVEERKDMHSMVCKKMFKLDCAEEDIPLKHKPLRVAAKSINW